MRIPVFLRGMARSTDPKYVAIRGVLIILTLPVPIYLVGDAFTLKYCEVDPPGDFQSHTGLTWAESAKVISAGDSHLDLNSGIFLGFGPGLQDGELFIVFDVDNETVEKWTAGPAPWGAEWQQGPVPEIILRKTSFSALDTAVVTFAASGSKLKSSFAYWDGSLLMLELTSGRVWFSSWNM